MIVFSDSSSVTMRQKRRILTEWNSPSISSWASRSSLISHSPYHAPPFHISGRTVASPKHFHAQSTISHHSPDLYLKEISCMLVKEESSSEEDNGIEKSIGRTDAREWKDRSRSRKCKGNKGVSVPFWHWVDSLCHLILIEWRLRGYNAKRETLFSTSVYATGAKDSLKTFLPISSCMRLVDTTFI